jgi:DnaD/phage-associated family protein
MAEPVLRAAQGETITLGAAAVRRLLEGRSGDAALLYLFRQTNAGADDARRALGWTEAQYAAAEGALRGMGLARAPERAATPPPETALPDYSREDVLRALERDAPFAAVLQEYERKLGRLSEPSLKKLLGLYDYLGLPADVLLLLLNYCAERKAAQFGAEKPPTMREIEKEGYVWARLELFSCDAADAYLCREHERRSRFGAYMKALGMEARVPVPGEERYLGAWLDWGFPPETVALAFDKTVLNCHEFKWPYCNGILRRWHEKGLHTPDQARAETRGEARGARRRKADPTEDKNAWMDEFLK